MVTTVAVQLIHESRADSRKPSVGWPLLSSNSRFSWEPLKTIVNQVRTVLRLPFLWPFFSLSWKQHAQLLLPSVQCWFRCRSLWPLPFSLRRRVLIPVCPRRCRDQEKRGEEGRRWSIWLESRLLELWKEVKDSSHSREKTTTSDVTRRKRILERLVSFQTSLPERQRYA